MCEIFQGVELCDGASLLPLLHVCTRALQLSEVQHAGVAVVSFAALSLHLRIYTLCGCMQSL
jgi:hypothetical protein